MRIKTEAIVTGIKRSKGEFEGIKYDSTKFYVQADLDDSKDNAKGSATTEYPFGTSDEYQKYVHLTFPFKAELELDIGTTGREQKVTLIAVKPLEMVKAQKVA